MELKTDIDKLMENFIDSDNIKETVILDGQKTIGSSGTLKRVT